MNAAARRFYVRVLSPIARKARFEKAGSIYHLAAYYLRRTSVLGVVDGGAYEGEHSRYLALLFPRAVIYAFEPSPDAFRELGATATMSGRIRAMQMALSDRSGTASLNVNRFGPTNSLLDSDAGDDAEAMFAGRGETVRNVEVKTTRLDDFARANPDFRCDVLKLDLQGSEMPAIRGAGSLITSHVKAIIAETRFKPLYVGDTLFPEMDRELAKSGFRLACLGEVTHHPQDGSAYESNALWLRPEYL